MLFIINTTNGFIIHQPKKYALLHKNIQFQSTKADTLTSLSPSIALKFNKLKESNFSKYISNHVDNQLFFDSLVGQCILEDRWDDYITLLVSIDDDMNELVCYCTLQACVNEGYVLKAYDLLQNNTLTAQPTMEMYNLVINSLCKERKYWRKSIHLLDQIPCGDTDKILKMHNTIISTCSTMKDAKSALQLLKSLKSQDNIHPDVISYNSVMNACIKAPHFSKQALKTFDEMLMDGVVSPDVITYTCAIRACTQTKSIKRALSLFQVAKDKGLPLDVHIYTAIINACSKSGKYYSRKAIDLFYEMEHDYIQPNAFTYSVVIGACGNSHQWELALQLFDEMKANKRLRLDVIVYNNVISALSKT